MKTRLSSPKLWTWIAFTLLMVAGAGVRLFHLYDQPLDFNSTRQLHSAVIARGMFYQGLEGAEPWQKDMALKAWQNEGLIEPPIMEALTAFAYRLAGKEILWAARLFSIIFWLTGGAALFLLMLEMAGSAGALAGLAYYLLLPFGVMASRSFQPDPLMTALMACALWAGSRWLRKPAFGSAALAGLLAGLAILTKSVVLFFIGGAWLGLLLSGGNLKKIIADRQVWLIGLLAALPSILFYIYGLFINGGLASQFGLRFFPALWLDPLFYLQWLGQVRSTTGFEWALVAFAASFLVAHPRTRWMLLGLWAGYLLYGMTFSFHITTHDYYQLPLILPAALGLSVALGFVVEKAAAPKKLAYAALGILLLFTAVTQAWVSIVTLKQLDYTSELHFWQKLGKALGRDQQVIGLTQDYGYRLYIYGWVESANWLRTNDINYRALAGQQFDTRTLFEQQVKGRDIFVITMPDELDKQPELKALLTKNYPQKTELGGTLVFDLRHPLNP